MGAADRRPNLPRCRWPLIPYPEGNLCLPTWSATTSSNPRRTTNGSSTKTYANWARPLKSVWVLVTDKSAEQIENGINAHTDTNDKVLVVRTARAGEWRDGAWRNLSDEITEWLQQNL